MSSNDCFCFTCQWFDPHAQLMRKYQMMFYVRSSVNEIELTDVKTRKLFLRRTPFPDINFEDLFVGSKIMIYSRQVRFLREANGMDSVLSAGAREGEERRGEERRSAHGTAASARRPLSPLEARAISAVCVRGRRVPPAGRAR